MVEMSETANILNNATARSLIVLDEIGRGTSTFDGLSLAWSIVEHLHNQVGAKTLFATHHHELTELSARLPRLKNFNVAVREWNDQIVFLRKIVEGGTDKSYGIQVARLAGVPKPVLERAKESCATSKTPNSPEGNVRRAAPAQRGSSNSRPRRRWICSVKKSAAFVHLHGIESALTPHLLPTLRRPMPDKNAMNITSLHETRGFTRQNLPRAGTSSLAHYRKLHRNPSSRPSSGASRPRTRLVWFAPWKKVLQWKVPNANGSWAAS
jgi:hypothetical protein